MITEISESKILTMQIININLMVESVTQIKSGITNVSANVKIQKNFVCVKKIIFGILLHAVVKTINIYKVLLSV